MSQTTRVAVTAYLSWVEAVQVMRRFLDSAISLPVGLTDSHLVELIDTCEHARQRLQEQNGG